MKDRKTEIVRMAQEATLNRGDTFANKEKALKSFSKARDNTNLYWEAYHIGKKGEFPLEFFTQLIPENDKMVQKKDHRNFKAGYMAGQKDAELENKTKNTMSR